MANAPGKSTSLLDAIRNGARNLVRRFHHEVVERGNPRVITEVLNDPAPRRYLDPAVLDKFALSPLIARLVVEGFINGLHKSPFHGFSVEFADHREYVPGDDLKYLDWQVFACTDRYYIKRYEEETNLGNGNGVSVQQLDSFVCTSGRQRHGTKHSHPSSRRFLSPHGPRQPQGGHFP